MFESQQYDYDESKDEYVPVGVKVPYLTLTQAKKDVSAAHDETE